MATRTAAGSSTTSMRWAFVPALSILMLIIPGGALAVCDCPFQGDIDASGQMNVADVASILDEIYRFGPSSPQDSNCPVSRADFNADGTVDVLDLAGLTQVVFFAQGAPQPPCDCETTPSLCDPNTDPSPGDPSNSVIVESKTAYEGDTGVPIRVRLTNSGTVRNVDVPLVAREVTPGSFITAARGRFAERLGNGTIQYLLYGHYVDPDGSCENGQAGGFATQNFTDTVSYHPVSASPEGFSFSSGIFFPPYLAPGSDATGSIILYVDVTSTPGTFEIDTTCTNPGNHLLFVEDAGAAVNPIVPAFTKGVITIITNTPPVAQCIDVNVATGDGCGADASIDNGSFDPDGGPVTLSQDPPGPYPLGATLVTLTAEDDRGVISTCQANVTVEDETAPVITCPGDTTINVPPVHTGAVVAYNASAVDNCGGPVTIDANYPSGGFIPEGINEVIVTATDDAGNQAQCSFYVTIMAVCFDRLADVNCDGLTDAVDLALMIDIVFFGADDPPPCTTAPN